MTLLMKRLLWALPLAASVVGCVDISKTQVKTEENVIAKVPKTVTSPRFAADVQVKGSILSVVVTPQCSVIEEETIERVEVSDKTVSGDSRAWMTALSLLGAIPLTSGTAMLIDAPNVYDSDLNGRFYNETGQDVVIGLGVTLAGVGLACVLPPMVNALRAVGSSETTTTTTRVGATVQEKVPCTGVVSLPTYSVVARFSSGHAVPLGGAMPNDQFDVDLRVALGPTIIGMNPPPEKVAIWINEKFQAEIPTSSIVEGAKADRDMQDDATWKASEVAACEKSPQACNQVQAYLARFPNGKYAEKARKLLQPRTSVVAAPEGQSKLGRAVDGAAKAVDDTSKKLTAESSKAFQKSQEQNDKEVKKACEKECTRLCEKDTTCRDACIVQVCP